MSLQTPYEISIPNDGEALLNRQGLLGPMYIEINTRGAKGATIPNNGVLKSLEPTR
jgi:ABC-type transporter Mla subunit MlaD